MKRLIVALLQLASLLSCAADEAPFTPPLYAFQNGIRTMPAGEGVRLLKELGYGGVGSVYPQYLKAFKAACEKESLTLHSIYAGGVVNAGGFKADAHVGEAIQLLKGSAALVELNVRRGEKPSDEQAIALVREIAGQAKSSGLKVVIYPHDNFHIQRLDHAVRIARACGRDNVGVTFNLCHFLKVQPGDDLAAALRDAGPLLWSASTCGADADGKDWSTLIRPLDEGGFDQRSLLRHLRTIGFRGPVGLQCFNIGTDARQHLPRSLKAWRGHLEAIRTETKKP
jgi:sugar phosphate isomerase/epimerase